jgi:hypothetical protein
VTGRPPHRLLLTTPFDVPTVWSFYETRENATSRSIEMASVHARRTATTMGLALVDWQRRCRSENCTEQQLVDWYAHPTVDWGVAVAWDELATVLRMRSSATYVCGQRS